MPKGKVWGYDTPDLKAIQMPSPVSQSDKHNYTFEVYKLEREGKCVSPKSITERMWVDGWMDRVTEQCLSCFKNLINHLFYHGTGQTFVRRCWSSSLMREKNLVSSEYIKTKFKIPNKLDNLILEENTAWIREVPSFWLQIMTNRSIVTPDSTHLGETDIIDISGPVSPSSLLLKTGWLQHQHAEN